jgi:hypothetical protein
MDRAEPQVTAITAGRTSGQIPAGASITAAAGDATEDAVSTTPSHRDRAEVMEHIRTDQAAMNEVAKVFAPVSRLRTRCQPGA